MADLVRVLLLAVSLVVLFLTPLYIQTATTVTIDWRGAVIDVVALAAIVATIFSWLRARR